jgi:activator of HSP90 ATPase
MKASAEEVWHALVKPGIIKKWSGSPAVMDDKEGTAWTLWGGEMFGLNLECARNKKLVQEWCTGSFKSKVTFTLKPLGKKTVVELVHEGVPEREYRNYSNGWKQYYLGAIQQMFEQQSNA